MEDLVLVLVFSVESFGVEDDDRSGLQVIVLARLALKRMKKLEVIPQLVTWISQKLFMYTLKILFSWSASFPSLLVNEVNYRMVHNLR